MRHHTNSRRLGVKTGHRTAMLRNLSKSLVEHGRIKTTVARAKNLRPFLEKVVTKLKDPNLHNIRQATSTLADKDTVKKIIDEIAPKLKTRAGGYLRILKLAQARVGDNADMAIIEWVEESLVPYYEKLTKKTSGAKKTKKSPAKAASKAPAKKSAVSKTSKKEDNKAKKASAKSEKK